ncbi:hypothetical protein PG987_016588 [Apiospora arundinis]
MKFSTVVALCFATAALGMPTGRRGATAAADKQLGGKGAAGANKGTPAARRSGSVSTTTSAAGNGNGNKGNGKGNGNGNGNKNNGNGNAAPPAKNATGPISESVIPDYGITAGQPSKAQPGSCLGANGINIPAPCPSRSPTRATRSAANRARINAIVNTLQNFNFDKTGRTGDGCPAASFPDLAAVQKKLQGGENVQVGSAGPVPVPVPVLRLAMVLQLVVRVKSSSSVAVVWFENIANSRTIREAYGNEQKDSFLFFQT